MILDPPRRLRIALFEFANVFEDFYSHYDVDHESFATSWAATGNHAFATVMQRAIGDVTWYCFTLNHSPVTRTHQVTGCRVRMMPSSLLHRWLWRQFYMMSWSWRLRGVYPAYAVLASYAASLSGRFLSELVREAPDVVFMQDYASGRFDLLALLSRLMGFHLVAYHAGSTPQAYVGKPLKHLTLRAAHRIIVSSRHEAQYLESTFRVHPDRMRVVLTPIETTIFAPLPREVACARVGLDPARRYLLFVGRIDDPVKRVTAIIKAFSRTAAEFAEFDLVVVGDGPDRERVQEYARLLLPGRVIFTGWADTRDRLVGFYNAADALLLASRSEGFPTVVGEAMACGTPVIAFDVGGVTELVTDGQTGFVVPSGNDEQFARAIQRALSSTSLLQQMRAAARSAAEVRVAPHAVAAALRECFGPWSS